MANTAGSTGIYIHLKLKQILSDPVKNVQLKMELAVVIDAGEPFVKSTYTL